MVLLARSKKADLTFISTTRSWQEDFPCWQPHSNVLKSHVSQHIFLSQEEFKWDMNSFFSHCILLIACLCLQEAASFMTLKANLNYTLRYNLNLSLICGKNIFGHTEFWINPLNNVNISAVINLRWLVGLKLVKE